MARHTLIHDMKYIIEKANQILTDLKYKKVELDEIENVLCNEGHSITYTALIIKIVSRELKGGWNVNNK